MTDHASIHSDAAPRRYPPVLGVCALVLATIIAYWPAIHAEYIWDDDMYVTENQLLRDADGLQRIWVPRNTPQYYPLVFSTFWVEYQLWELEPMGYHVTNILLHAASAVLLWIVMIRLKVPGAWLIAAVFALHPVMVESVAWISERKNVLSMFFYLCAALAYLNFDRIRFGTVNRLMVQREPWGWYGMALLLFIAALLSKTVTCSLPAALILIMLWQRTPITFARLLPLAPMFVIGFALAMLTVVIEREHVGARGVEFDLSFIERCLIASKALLFYPWKLIWPHPLMFIYPRWEIDAGNIMQYWSLIVCAIIGLACVVAFWRGWRGPFVALSFYAGTVFPAIGFFNVYPHIFSFVADHFVYHASIGIITFVIGGGSWLLWRVFARGSLPVQRDPLSDPASADVPTLPPAPRQVRIGQVAVAVVILPIFFALTWSHATVFHDAETLYRDNIEKNPEAWMPRNNLSSVLLKQAEEAMFAGDTALMRERAREAAEQAQAVLERRPGHHTAHANLSEALRVLGDLDGALHHVERAIEELDHFPHYRWQKGRLHQLRGEYDKAIDAFAAAVERAPRHRSYRIELIRMLMQEQRIDEATGHLRALLEVDPNNFFALSTLGAIRQHQQREREATRLLQRALEVAPSADEYFQIVARLIRLYVSAEDQTVRDLRQARSLAESLVRATGQDPGALAVLASVHAEAGEIDEAVAIMERAIEIARAEGVEPLVAQLEEQLRQLRGQP